MRPYVAGQVDIQKALSIGGWMSERELTWLATMAQEHTCITEFGSFHGRSTRALADNSPSWARIWAVDPWNGEMLDETGCGLGGVNTYVMPSFKKNLRDHIDAGKVIPVRKYSSNFQAPTKMDMVFIDSDHRKEAVRKDIPHAISMLRPGGILCGHDYGHPLWVAVKEAVDELLKDVQVEETIWWTQKF